MTSVLKVDNIQNSSGTDAISIDSSGIITPTKHIELPKQPRFYGWKAANQTLTRGTITKITGFTNAEVDTQSAFDGTTFTVPVAGDYYLFASLYHDFTPAGNDGESMTTYIYRNGSGISFSHFRNHSTRDIDNNSLSTQAIWSLSVGDTIEVYGYLSDNNGGNGQIASSLATHFGGYMLG